VKRRLLGILHFPRTLMPLALATTVWSAPLPRTQWLPLQAGNQWTLTATNGNTRVIQIDATPPGPWQATGLFDQPVAVRFASGGDLNLQARGADRGPWQTLARFGRKENRPWQFDLTGNTCGGTRAWWDSSDATIVTPAGTFTGCRRWHSVRLMATANDCPSVATADIWFAPDTGPVGLLTGVGDWYWLTAARVGDRVYPRPPNGIVAQLTTDESVYTNISDHLLICPPCATNIPPCAAPCYLSGGTNATAAFDFTVTNATDQPQTFIFPGQKFDIQLIDTNGVVVALWSIGKAFPNFVIALVLPPGQSLDYSAQMELVDRTGAPLHGPYTARAFLTNTAGPTGIEASTTFQVIYELVPGVVTIQPSSP